MLLCMSCTGLSTLKCPDCRGCGRTRSTRVLEFGNVPVLDGTPCSSCSTTGRVHCEACIGIGAMRCSDCRGLGHIKCDCAIQAGYARDRL